MIVEDLARELGVGSGDVLRAAKALGIDAKNSTSVLRPTHAQAIRKWLAARPSSEPVPPVPPPVVAPENPLAPLQLLPRAGVRDTRDAPRAETSFELLYHRDFHDWLESSETPARLRKRADLVLKQFVAFGHPTHVTAVAGEGKGWRRSKMGGNGGKHYYLWWAPAGAIPVEGNLSGKQVLLRAVRHHDATDTGLDAGVPSEWLPVTTKDIAETPDVLAYPTEAQRWIARDRSPVRVIQGHPGAGKTTALHLAADYAVGDRGLFIVFSRRLRDETEQQLRALGPRGLAIDVLTFDELLGEFEPAGSPRAVDSPEESAEAMEAALRRYHERLGVWEGHAPELYAELHAHFVGRALPVAFRATKPAATETLSAAAYITAREAVLGEPAARAAAAVGTCLAKLGLVRKLFPGPSRARLAVDHLLAAGGLPPRLARIDWVFVDEVQDLTLVEALLVVELCRQNAIEQQRVPGLVVAGDESQTVRPTDFEWGPFNEMVTVRLGSKTERTLPGNVRSPRNIAGVVNASWALYGSLPRLDRPSGRSTAGVDDTTAGQVIYCRLGSDQERRELLDAFKTTPGAALIYPGFQVPARYADSDKAVWSSATAKGLDFQIVGVLDAGRQIVAMKRLAAHPNAEGRISSIWARTLADQFRVAISRATDTLVLIDEGSDVEESKEVHALCESEPGEWIDGFVEHDVHELVAHLEGDGGDVLARVTDLLSEATKFLQDLPEQALRKARQASGFLGNPNAPGAITDAATRKEVARFRGVAALLAAVATKGKSKSYADLVRESNTWLRKAELGAAARAANHLQRIIDAFLPGGRPAHVQVSELLTSLPVLAREVPEITTEVRKCIVVWSKRVVDGPLPQPVSDRQKLDAAFSAATAEYGTRHPELPSLGEKLRARIAKSLLSESSPKPALEFFERLQSRDLASEGRCYELLGEFGEASRRYERAAILPEALRCAREVPDLQRALNLAQTLGAVDVATLEWLAEVRKVLESRPASGGAAVLTAAEHRVLASDLESAVDAARPKLYSAEVRPSAGGRTGSRRGRSSR